VLVVDDDRFMRVLARDALEEAGFAVAQAANGSEALQALEELSPSLILLDLNMPEVDGFTTCREIRRRERSDPTPILVLTAANDQESVDRAYEAGATDFSVKPVNWPLLAHRVRYLLRASRAFSDLRDSEVYLAKAQRIARLGSWQLDTETDEMHWSDETFRILALRKDEISPSLDALLDAVHPDDREQVRYQIVSALQTDKPFTVEHRVLLPGDVVRFVRQQGEARSTHRDSRVTGTIQDVTERKAARDRIRKLANYDSLTGLANRRLFRERLQRALTVARSRRHLIGLLYLDLDRFKRINDTLGHSTGDELLVTVAERLRVNLRASDMVTRPGGRDFAVQLSRLGGDEFTILLSKLSGPEDAEHVARRILREVPKSIEVNGHDVSLTASLGIAIFPIDGQDVETLVKHADTAMYHAKERGGNGYQFFSESMNQTSLRKLRVESRLRRAIEQGELGLHYQPRVDLATRRVVGVEALVRLSDPELGTISPEEFIPIAEDTGLIIPMWEWVLRNACEQSRAWQDAGHSPLCLSVNVSARQFLHQDISHLVGQTLKRTRLDAKRLELELTESVMIEGGDHPIYVLKDLKRMGVRIALDDFGTGYSALSYVTRLPLDTLKIDRSFISDLGSDPSAAGVTKAVISLAHSLDMRVVAEGVDCETHLRFLEEHGCDEAQGFLFSEPLPPEELTRFLRSGPRLPGSDRA
jgi:predicted signal transduction protein with EAL and GGDEF domain